ncbi:MAG TPA: adenylate/guanylate cyclase domain-containing protein [Flexivirga sp.]|uniref:adenylate/guanylate cyclase domain-containing protein n=1 Tax=Flexivirga sp. TaxID=1962927 RepID=UPI002C83A6B1|nr:adenylate/guanylate cyclase domain-containing protein [Flexivirga sp.]HWC23454.1 adenylate/guanylate cyclase domain-containing protein [Flexivirga sp.]
MRTCARCGAELAAGARFCSSCGAAAAQGALQAPVRKHVVILFCDIVGSTTLGEFADPEALRERLGRYFQAVSQVIWQHGGTVEKFIGDAVMAVFGVPSSREDDAIRAVRSASAIHEAVAGLSAHDGPGKELHVRIGVNSGEVFVAHQPDGQFSVTGDAVNTAQRLEAAAGTDQTYVGDTVAELVRGEIVLDEVGEILHKGRTVPQRVFQVAADQNRELAVREPAFVGREVELADLATLADRSAARKQGWLLTYVGDAGIGKSRLVRQFVTERRDRLRVVAGGCDAMSTGAFAPLAGWLSNLADDWQAYVGELLADDATPVLQRLRSAVGMSDAQTSTEDVVWAVHAILAAMCETSPVASVWDDLHWATAAQLDFIGRLAASSRTLPVLTICLARPELFDVDPDWGGGRKARVEDVEPLDYNEMLAVAAERIALQAGDVAITAEDLVDRADGNPQVVQLLAQSAAAGGALPASVTQLYEAALDRLSPDERAMVEAAAVYGRRFPAAPVGAVAEVSDPVAVLDRLRERNVLEVAGDRDYRFAQTVFMQTAYRTMSKRTRITRHSALADWVAEHRDALHTDTVALIASHRKRAFDLLEEIEGSPAERTALRGMAVDAALESLLAMQLRGDPGLPDAVERLLDVAPTGDVRHFEAAHAAWFLRNRVEPERWLGWLDRLDVELADDRTWQIIRRAPRTLAGARGGDVSLEQTRAETLQMLEQLGDDEDVTPLAVDIVSNLLAQAEADLGNFGACHRICLAGIARAQRGGRVYIERMWRSFDIQAAYIGVTPLPEVIADARTLQDMVSGQRQLWCTTSSVLAGALAGVGDLDGARSQWAAVEAAHADETPAERAFHLQHYPPLLLAEGRPRDSAHYAAELAAAASMPSFVASLLGTAARDAIFAGDLAFAVECCRRLVMVELPSTLAFLEDVNSAFMIAVQCALRGDRVGAFRQIELNARIERPEESPLDAAFMHTMTAIVERLLGDEDGAATAADRARAALTEKGATALVSQVDRWVGNAEQLRSVAA